MSWPISTAGVVLLVTTLTACAVESDPVRDFNDDVRPTLLYITEIQVDETDPFSDLEVEVHLYDADTGERLGCTGQLQGLDGVDDPNREYIVASAFVRPDNTGLLLFADVRDRSLVLEVSERDPEDNVTVHCPARPGGADDMIGVSDPVAGSSLDPARDMAFGDVTHLVIGTSRTRL